MDQVDPYHYFDVCGEFPQEVNKMPLTAKKRTLKENLWAALCCLIVTSRGRKWKMVR